jgi:MoaA/NifB/PqqE/SkfB family radical SAM enzyme
MGGRILVINPYRPQWLYRLRRRLAASPRIQRLHALADLTWRRLVGYSTPAALPGEIHLETVSRCNADCAFCPVSRGNDPRPPTTMSAELVGRIAAELHAADYDGVINLFLNNEPLIDRRLADFCRQLHTAAPRAEICVFTNGKLLNLQRYLELFDAGLGILCINDYGDASAPAARTRTLLAGLAQSPHPQAADYARRSFVRLRLQNEVLHNRMGRAPNKGIGVEYRQYLRNGCFRPFEQMVVRSSGEISLCCSDSYGEATLGDLNTQSIAEVWNGPVYRHLRDTLSRHGRGQLPLCEHCDANVSFLDNRQKHRLAHAVLNLAAAARRLLPKR